MRNARHVGGLQLVVASPLSRALDTATLVLPEATARLPFMANDNLRERSGWMLNAKRRTKTEQAKRYPQCDFALLDTEDDELWEQFGGELEPPSHCAERGYRFLRWLSARDESEIAVVAHGGLFHYLLNDHPHVKAEGGRAVSARFGNCEMRMLALSWTGSGDTRTFVVRLPSFVESHFATKVEYDAWRATVDVEVST